MDILPFIQKHKIIASVNVPNPDVAPSIINKIIEGGLRLVAINITSHDSLDLISQFSTNEQVLIGACNVYDKNSLQQVVGTGARFIISSHLDPEVIKACRDRKVFVIATALTPTEVSLAHRFRANLIRIFPLDVMGGPVYLQNIYEGNKQLMLMAAGLGISKQHVLSYFQAGATAVEIPHVALGSEALKNGDWPKMAVAAEKVVQMA